MIDRLGDPSELHYLLETGTDVPTRHAEDAAVQLHVLTPGEFPVEARPHLDEGAHSAANAHSAGGGIGDAADDLERRALAGAIVADKSDCLAGWDLEADVVKRSDDASGGVLTRLPREDTAEIVPKRAVAVRTSIALGYLVEADGDQSWSAKSRSNNLNK